MSKPAVRYFVFDVESAADANLVAKVRHPGEDIEPHAAVREYRDQLMEKNGSDFIPYTFQFPVSIVVAKVAADFSLLDLVALDEPEFRPHIMTELFWRGWNVMHPTLVTFNGRTFDVPLLELAAYRYGIGVPKWFSTSAKSFEQPRYRYNADAHLDLQDLLTNFGAARFNGGLNLAANVLGKPGKMDVQGHMVQDLYDAGKFNEINDYCRCDVLDTYFVFLRCQVMLGAMTLEREHELVLSTKAWLQERSAITPIYRQYIERWGDWKNPWV